MILKNLERAGELQDSGLSVAFPTMAFSCGLCPLSLAARAIFTLSVLVGDPCAPEDISVANCSSQVSTVPHSLLWPHIPKGTGLELGGRGGEKGRSCSAFLGLETRLVVSAAWCPCPPPCSELARFPFHFCAGYLVKSKFYLNSGYTFLSISMP